MKKRTRNDAEGRLRDYDSMCDKGKICVLARMQEGESRPDAVLNCWKKVDVRRANDFGAQVMTA